MHNNLRTIETARSFEAINKAAKKGYWPLIKPVVPSPDIKTKFAVYQNPTSGLIKVLSDFRSVTDTKGFIEVISFTYYYPHNFESPYAAYLIPFDIKVDEHVWLNDLIEDVVKSIWNQGDSFRLASCEAVWDGKDLILQAESVTDETIVG